eukprot:TRINITY_DN12228_c1_g2_i13.p2 TRINITY_DN12228_c1_g2~~TRINITY_DN12228_c1_g2_i13.p2  ORF type:complete len:114 (+),score=11.72 TRINITY_DN12228_c1_g2_i13:94-435(+)
MRLLRFLLRYYPPGIILEYTKSNQERSKCISLSNLNPETNLDELTEEIAAQEILITEKRKPQLKQLLQRLQEQLVSHNDAKIALNTVWIVDPQHANYVTFFAFRRRSKRMSCQ